MVASNIKVFLRVRPCAKPSPAFQGHPEQGSVTFELEKQTADYEVNNVKTNHSFRFDGLLGMKASQEEVLDMVAKPVINDVLEGVNGTIFAYGQTGSGKTFTITGGAERYDDRGMIPRTIKYMFDSFQKRDAQYRMYISYLEIYNDAGYDLLRDDSAQKLEDLPKVELREDADGNIHLRNLSVNVAGTEEDALNLLFLGDTNRMVAETPMNDASTRSHCLFIIWIDSTKPGSDVVRRSKLHLVDLAGSERVSRTGVEGNLLKEAKYINLSLHYLEQVIVALHDRSKGKGGHVPYRNSMMTSVLRDSLGGNCKTTMVGCIATEPSNIMESISTCRFAQRVAQIQNNARVNEELDPNLLIARLKRELADLKAEVKVAKKSKEGEQQELLDEDIDQCRALVLQYVSNKANPAEPFMCGSVDRLRASFKILRDLCRSAEIGHDSKSYGHAESDVRNKGGCGHDAAREAALQAEARNLQIQIAQRDQEIGVLMQMLSKQKGGEDRPFISGAAPAPPVVPSAIEGRPGGQVAQQCPPTLLPAAYSRANAEQGINQVERVTDNKPGSQITQKPPDVQKQPNVQKTACRRIPGTRGTTVPLPGSSDAAELLLDPQHAFEVFRESVRQPESFEENKQLLKQKMAEAKSYGDEANAVRAGINAAKTRLEKLRTERAMTAAGNSSEPIEDGPEEVAEIQEIDRLKVMYRERTAGLRRVKGDVERIQQLLEQNKMRLQREFEAWFASLRQQATVDNLNEDKKRELYEKVTGSNSAITSRTSSPANKQASAQMQPQSLATAKNDSSVTHGSRRLPSDASTQKASQRIASSPSSTRTTPSTSQLPKPSSAQSIDDKVNDDISAFYAAFGELTKHA